MSSKHTSSGSGRLISRFIKRLLLRLKEQREKTLPPRGVGAQGKEGPPVGRSSERAEGDVRPFHEIPGPWAAPLIGSTWKYILPHKGRYDPERLHKAAALKYDQYGPLVRETLPDGSGLVSVFDPEDIKSFLAQTSKQPDRRSHLALKKYRLDRPHKYSSGGLLPSNGSEWRRLRKASQGIFGRKDAVLGHLHDVDKVMRDFISLVKEIRAPDDSVADMMEPIKRMNLEVLCATLLDVRLGCMVGANAPPHCRALMLAGGLSTQATLGTDNGPLQLYRWFNTPLYRQLVQSQDLIYSVAKRHYDGKKQRLMDESSADRDDGKSSTSILEHLMRSPSLGERDVVGLVCDSLMAGVDTTSYSLAFALHHLARHRHVQQRLAQEATELLTQTKGEVTAEVLANARYAGAVLKETFRLSPISIGIGRVNSQWPIVIRGYHIPEGTTIVSMNQHISRNPLYFDEPNTFRPERFLAARGQQHQKQERQWHSYSMLPFGQGSRMCIAQNIARQTLLTALLQISYHYELEWLGPTELDCRVRLINEPDGPIALRFSDRTTRV